MMKRLMVLVLVCCSIIAPIECQKKEKQGGNANSIIKEISKKLSDKRLDVNNVIQKIRNNPDPLIYAGGVTALAIGSSVAGYEFEFVAIATFGLIAGSIAYCFASCSDGDLGDLSEFGYLLKDRNKKMDLGATK